MTSEQERIRFAAWALDKDHDMANTYDTERSRWLWLSPMTADLWECWLAALSAAPAGVPATGRCTYCDGSGDVHGLAGEWRDTCTECDTAAWQYATRLAESLHAKHYGAITQWKPLPDLLGVLTQIDNMVAGLAAPLPPQQAATQPAAQPAGEEAKDAARYRWLRSTTNWVSSKGERIDVRNQPQLWDESIDACIDAARGEQTT